MTAVDRLIVPGRKQPYDVVEWVNRLLNPFQTRLAALELKQAELEKRLAALEQGHKP